MSEPGGSDELFFKKYARYRCYAITAVSSFVGLVMLILWFHVLWNEYAKNYKMAFDEAEKEKSQAESLWVYCSNKPIGYKDSVCDCSLAATNRKHDPDTIGKEKALEHLVTYHLSPKNWILGCHSGVCDGFLSLLMNKLLDHFALTTVTTLTISILVILFLLFPLRKTVQFGQLKFEKSKRLNLSSSGSTKTAHLSKLIDALKDSHDVSSSLRELSNTELVKQARDELVQNTTMQQGETVIDTVDLSNTNGTIEENKHYDHQPGMRNRPWIHTTSNV
jgi:hypothetical protein